MAKRFRDKNGRFCKSLPAPPLDPKLVSQLGAHRRPEILMVADHELVVTIFHPKLITEDKGDQHDHRLR